MLFYIINVFTVIFDQFNASLLNNIINLIVLISLEKNKQKNLLTPNF